MDMNSDLFPSPPMSPILLAIGSQMCHSNDKNQDRITITMARSSKAGHKDHHGDRGRSRSPRRHSSHPRRGQHGRPTSRDSNSSGRSQVPPPGSSDASGKRRSPEENSEAKDDDRPTSKFKKATTAEAEDDASVFRSKGAIFGRYVDMWTSFPKILDTGITRDLDESDEQYTHDENTTYYSYVELVRLFPQLPIEMDNIGLKGSAVCGRLLNDGRKTARSRDVYGVKDNISKWRKFDPPFPGDKERHRSGFHHDLCGMLLCPTALDWNDPKVREGLRQHTIIAGPEDLPLLLYANEQFIATDMFAGFLKNMLLVQAYFHIFIGPKAALSGDSESSARAGNAALHGISSVSMASIAYVATIVRFVLSSQASFGAGDRAGQWPYRMFFRQIMSITEQMGKRSRKALLQWWDEKIYASTKNGLDENSSRGTGLPGTSVAAQMMAAAAAAAAREDTPSSDEGDQ
ncbi:hypothetical protein PLICRDRAFT_45802 [Plicaturopsis crispa FD-325 SS-3]|uniref:Uncharacterized protein n=1 Tax=Plicaturopsis crispa FD-325 SS-3 TaxID=944288 RepID=A0A0C9SL66_PLICR|nr:hypothetical protein PLICRDRAFT_45802 [Plicaturopsis crispa FD-325 SS-3]